MEVAWPESRTERLRKPAIGVVVGRFGPAIKLLA
jgi:hypothetical protein